MKNNPNKKIVTRFAPSPTGTLHLGSFRTALFNYLYAKHFGGKVILRIEDTDKVRSKPEYEQNIHDGLAWLGLKFDEVYRQSDRSKIYAKFLAQLIAEDKAYVSEEDLTKTTDGNLSKQVIRFRNPNKVVSFSDIIRGEVSFDTTELGDFVIAKNLDEPLYNFAVVVDDFDMGITHVIRGEDHISNTPRQTLIVAAIGAPLPIYAHVPLILAPDKSKLSKRRGALALTEYRERGYLPEAMVNFMAMLGWNPGTDEEMFLLDELIKRFDLADVQKSSAVYNEDKLRWINREYLKRKPHREIANEVLLFIKNSQIFKENKWKMPDDLLMRLVPVFLDRMSVYTDITAMFEAHEFDYLFETPKYEPADLIWRDEKGPEKTQEYIKKTLEILDKTTEEEISSAENVKKLLWNYATENGRGNVLWPIRFALSGKIKSPDPFTLAALLGKKETLKRLEHALKVLSKSFESTK